MAPPPFSPPLSSSSKDQEEDDLLTIREVARRLRVDETTVRRWLRNGSLDGVILPHVGKRNAYRVKRSVLDRILNSSTLPPG